MDNSLVVGTGFFVGEDCVSAGGMECRNDNSVGAIRGHGWDTGTHARDIIRLA